VTDWNCVFGLTRQQKWIVGITISLLVLGWVVRELRLAELKAAESTTIQAVKQ
jgi:hypothetical protein